MDLESQSNFKLIAFEHLIPDSAYLVIKRSVAFMQLNFGFKQFAIIDFVVASELQPSITTAQPTFMPCIITIKVLKLALDQSKQRMNFLNLAQLIVAWPFKQPFVATQLTSVPCITTAKRQPQPEVVQVFEFDSLKFLIAASEPSMLFVTVALPVRFIEESSFDQTDSEVIIAWPFEQLFVTTQLASSLRGLFAFVGVASSSNDVSFNFVAFVNDTIVLRSSFVSVYQDSMHPKMTVFHSVNHP